MEGWERTDGSAVGTGSGPTRITDTLPANVALRTGIRINEGGRARLMLGTTPIFVNNSFAAHPRTGSIGDAVVRTDLLAAENRFTLEIRRRTDGDVQHIRTLVNGILVNEWSGPAGDPGDALDIELLEPDTRIEARRIRVATAALIRSPASGPGIQAWPDTATPRRAEWHR